MAEKLTLASAYRKQHSPNKKTARRAKAFIKAHKKNKKGV